MNGEGMEKEMGKNGGGMEKQKVWKGEEKGEGKASKGGW